MLVRYVQMSKPFLGLPPQVTSFIHNSVPALEMITLRGNRLRHITHSEQQVFLVSPSHIHSPNEVM